MTPLALIPDGEAVVAKYLNAHPDLVALGARVAGRTPNSMSDPWVRLTQLDAPKSARSRPDHLISFLFQLDCYAGDAAMADFTGQKEASKLARTVRAALDAMPDQTFDDVVVTDAQFALMPRIPDDSQGEPARERFALTATVRMHSK